MKSMIIAIALILTSSAFAKDVTRCGWIANPTPANYWITDADGTWDIGTQGGYQAEGQENMSYPDDAQFVNNNGNYGYWCGCVTGSFDTASMRVINIVKSKAKLLKDCLKDPNLSNP